MKRRNFLGMAMAVGLLPFFPGSGRAGSSLRPGLPLHVPGRERLGRGGVFDLTAAPGNSDLGTGPQPGALLFNDQWPSPTMTISQGEAFNLTLYNELDEPTIVHWHGLTPPADMDGHPTQVIDPGTSRPYQFAVEDRPGTYWYHPHPHHRTGIQVYSGLAGFLLVDDGKDAARGLPAGNRDLPLLLADKRVNDGKLVPYDPGMADMGVGFLGNATLVNGQLEPAVSVEPAVLRLRLLNGSTARILNPAFADGRSFWLIGTDAGLLDAPVEVTSVLMSPGERVEILVDLREDADATLNLISETFSIFDQHPPESPWPPQGASFDLMTINVDLPLDGPAGQIPTAFDPMPEIDSQGAPLREFNLSVSSEGHHLINGVSYDMERIDFIAPFDTVEIWRFTNTSPHPHPMHMHGAHFRVVSRSGASTPTDAGWKDTVLVRVGETVDVALRFRNPGLFLLHCHNLEHEDHGMMMNFAVASDVFSDRFESP